MMEQKEKLRTIAPLQLTKEKVPMISKLFQNFANKTFISKLAD